MPIWKYFCVLCERDIEEWHRVGGHMKRGVCPSCTRLSWEQMENVPTLSLEDLMSNIDWNAIATEKAQGMSVKDLAAKHGISTAGIYAHFRDKKAPVVHANGNGRTSASYAQVIADLVARRDKLNETIATLEELEAA